MKPTWADYSHCEIISGSRCFIKTCCANSVELGKAVSSFVNQLFSDCGCTWVFTWYKPDQHVPVGCWCSWHHAELSISAAHEAVRLEQSAVRPSDSHPQWTIPTNRARWEMIQLQRKPPKKHSHIITWNCSGTCDWWSRTTSRSKSRANPCFNSSIQKFMKLVSNVKYFSAAWKKIQKWTSSDVVK